MENRFQPVFPPATTRHEGLVGVPPTEISNAIVGFVEKELDGAAMRSLRFYSRGNTITISGDPKFSDFKGAGQIDMYADRVHMYCEHHSEVAIYEDPKFFDQVERFIHMLPTRLRRT
jgi:hypothetical protein